MKRIKKNLSAILFFFIICLLLSITFKLGKIQFISFGYVYSGSMEPTIMTNDGYILIHAKNYKVNDIICFKPSVLKQELITHRIIDTTQDNKFITQGDNNVSSDQEFGEPSVSNDQILGRVLMIYDKPVTIPYLGVIITKLNPIIGKLNIFIIISICVGVYAAVYVWRNIIKHNNVYQKKHIRFKEIAPFLDPVFFLFFFILIINSDIIGTTFKSWGHDKIDYIVTTTKGTSSPLPGEKFMRSSSFIGESFIPFVIILKPMNSYNTVNPNTLYLAYNQVKECDIMITAPYEIGMHSDLISIQTYPDVLPKEWFNFLYNINTFLPVIVIFIPGIIINSFLLIWWIKRWKMGNRKIMNWMIPIRQKIKRLS